jgi:hypothetical protein
MYLACPWLEGRIGVALGSQLVAYRLPSKWLWGRIEVALGGFGVALPESEREG